MNLQDEFNKDMDSPGIVWGMPDYIEWLEKKLIEIQEYNNEEDTYKKRWNYIKDDPDGARALLLLLKNGKGTGAEFDLMVDRIIESRAGQINPEGNQ